MNKPGYSFGLFSFQMEKFFAGIGPADEIILTETSRDIYIIIKLTVLFGKRFFIDKQFVRSFLIEAYIFKMFDWFDTAYGFQWVDGNKGRIPEKSLKVLRQVFMDSHTLDNIIKQFSKDSVRLFVQSVREGKELTPEALYANSAWRAGVEALLDECLQYTETGCCFHPAGNEAEMAKLQGQVDSILSQKERLLKYINETEQHAQQADSFYRNALINLIDFFHPREAHESQTPLLAFRRLLKGDSSLEQLSEEFRQLKDRTLKASLQTFALSKSAPGPFSFLRNRIILSRKGETGEKECVDQIRSSFQDIIDEIRLTLGEDALSSIVSIEDRIRNMNTIQEYISIRLFFVSVLHKHMLTLNQDRQQAAAFIRDIGERFVEMEGYILESLAFTRDAYTTDSEFNTALKQQIDELKSKVNFSKTLNDIKQSMFARLSAIKQIINKKNQEDMIRRTHADERITVLQNNVDQMKIKIKECRRHAGRMEKEAMMDPLTGIYNRRAYDHHIKEEFQRYRRYQQTFSMLFFDVDFFKQINDTYGHAVGDKCLEEIAKRVRKTVRESDFMARYGGEEFVVVLPGTGRDSAREVAEKIRNVVACTEFIHKSDTVKITISVGVTTVHSQDKTPGDLFSRLDAAMYEAKKTGRNKVVVM